MLNNRLTAAKNVAGKLFALEDAIEDAVISASELTAAIPAARRHARLSAVVGQDAFALTAASLAALHEARAKIVAAHHAFAEVQDQLGVKVRMGGGLWKLADVANQPTLAEATGQARLSLVHDRSAA